MLHGHGSSHTGTGVGIIKEVGNSVRKVTVYDNNEVNKWLHLRLNSWAEVTEEVKHNSDGKESIILIVLCQHAERKLEQILYKWSEHLAVWKTVEDLNHNIP